MLPLKLNYIRIGKMNRPHAVGNVFWWYRLLFAWFVICNWYCWITNHGANHSIFWTRIWIWVNIRFRFWIKIWNWIELNLNEWMNNESKKRFQNVWIFFFKKKKRCSVDEVKSNFRQNAQICRKSPNLPKKHSSTKIQFPKSTDVDFLH